MIIFLSVIYNFQFVFLLILSLTFIVSLSPFCLSCMIFIKYQISHLKKISDFGFFGKKRKKKNLVMLQPCFFFFPGEWRLSILNIIYSLLVSCFIHLSIRPDSHLGKPLCPGSSVTLMSAVHSEIP